MRTPATWDSATPPRSRGTTQVEKSGNPAEENHRTENGTPGNRRTHAEEERPGRKTGPGIAGQAADTLRKANAPGVTPGTAKGDWNRHRKLLALGIRNVTGRMKPGRKDVNVPVRRFTDLSILVQAEGETPRPLRRVNEQAAALQPLYGAAEKRR